MDLFIVPRRAQIDESKGDRAIKSVASILKAAHLARSWEQINNTRKQSVYYSVVFDNEWFDPRLVSDLNAFLVYSVGIDMFTLFRVNGEGEVSYQPRVFNSSLKLNPDIKSQPLPFNHKTITFEKILGGWLYFD